MHELVELHQKLYETAKEAETEAMRLHPQVDDNLTDVPAVPGSSLKVKQARFRAQMLWKLVDRIQKKLQKAAFNRSDDIKLKLDYPEAFWLWKSAVESDLDYPDTIIWDLDRQL